MAEKPQVVYGMTTAGVDMHAGHGALSLDQCESQQSRGDRPNLNGLARFTTLLAGKVRRQFLVAFRPAYVARKAAERRGECSQCGSCCVLACRCPFLNRQQLCTVYHSVLRPRVCVVFPLDERDLRDVYVSSGRVCGYHFEATASAAMAYRGSP
jgi:hypothetical protein